MKNSIQERMRFVLGLSLYALAALWGMVQVPYPIGGVPYLLFVLALASTMTYWCIVDGRVAGRPILYSFYWLIFFLWPLAVPIYLVWARRLRGLGFALLHAVGLFGVNFLAFHLDPWILKYFLMFRGAPKRNDGVIRKKGPKIQSSGLVPSIRI